MPGLNRRIDWSTGDYVSNGRGGHETTNTVEVPAYLELTIHRRSHIADPTRGSDLHLLPMENADALTVALARDTAAAALQRLVNAGLAKNLVVDVAVSDDNEGRIIGETSIDDAMGGPVDLSGVVGFGRNS